MDKITIVGGRRLQGEITMSGAKNAALPILAASLSTGKEVVLHSIPMVRDVHVMIELMRACGARVEVAGDTVRVEASRLDGDSLLDNPLVHEIRYSIHLLTALLPRVKKVAIGAPGGCVIGVRRLDSFIVGLTELGAEIRARNDVITARLTKLHGSHIVLEYPSVSATESTIMAACLSEGKSIIRNVAKEPEIVDLANFLNSMGARIVGVGTDIIEVEGVDELGGAEHTIIPDRVETGTYMVAAAVTGGDVVLKNTKLDHLESVVTTLKRIGVKIEDLGSGTRVSLTGRLCATDIVTEVYTGFPTDMQPIVTPLLAIASGESRIRETIFEHRFNHVPELVKMGADIRTVADTMFVRGPREMRGAEVGALDLRSGASLVLAGLAARGETIIDGAEQIFRGYEDLLGKLKRVGAKCALVESS
jgi:UDP-N-acetylglucosamine 1-carboxyvinyltransferase